VLKLIVSLFVGWVMDRVVVVVDLGAEFEFIVWVFACLMSTVFPQ